jgi:3D-(3,5/4)-trihydroxycyclohexane-1,2-dione acylhydrolase (decyclizing)
MGIAVVGDARAAVDEILIELRKGPRIEPDPKWQTALARAKKKWDTYLQNFFEHPVINGKLTQPAAVKAIDDYVNGIGGIKIFDAGDVQAHGFQICRHEQPKTYLNETGNSCMGFGICAAFGLGLVPGTRYPTAIIGDGSFLMQAQAIRDMVKHKSNCTIVVLDNQAMGAITALQWAQQYDGFATVDPTKTQPVDYAMLARSMGCQAYAPRASTGFLTDALDQAFRHEGPAVVDVKVHFGPEKYAALDAFGRWNVGPWSEQVENIWEGKAKPE